MNLINTRLTWLHLLTCFYYSLSHLSFLMFGLLGSDCANYCLGPTDAWKCCASEVLVSSASYYSSCGGCGVDGMCNLCNTDAYKLNSAETKCETKIKAIGESCALLMDCRFSCKGPTGAKKCCAFQLQYNSLCGGCGTDGMCNFCRQDGADTEDGQPTDLMH